MREVLETLAEPVLSEAQPGLAVLLLYEDFQSALRTRHALDHVALQIVPELRFSFDLCRIDLLHDPAVRRQVASEAAESDIIAVAAHGNGALPSEIFSWLCQWLDHKHNSPYALVVSLDNDARSLADIHAALAFLRSMAAETGVDFSRILATSHRWKSI